MSVHVFCGPTITAEEAAVELDAHYSPPAAEGDVYRAAMERPRAIAIIDGYFQSVPAVRHKEILWAMSQGIHVYGSASMGALRAAELSAFGMRGVGRVFEWFRDGVLEDDDEVAVVHRDAKAKFAAASEAMVNIRQTLRKARTQRVVSKAVSEQLIAIAKDLFYAERSYPSIFHRARALGIPAAPLMRLREWVEGHHVDQKRDDALRMLRLMRRELTTGIPPKRVAYSFQNTLMWKMAIASTHQEITAAQARRRRAS